MRVDLHNHTYLCKHASGTIESYILQAIEKGIDIFGFSCHNPMDYDEKYRMRFEEFDEYTKEVLRLKQKYQDKIEILLALEMDFLPHRMELLDKRLLDTPLDYLIGSVHFLDDWGFDNPEFIGEYKKRNMRECWMEYLECIKKMVESKLFQIVGHFDLLKVFNHTPPKEVFFKIQEVLQVLAQNEVALEINASGLRKPIGEQYPSREILQEAYNLGVYITFGSDAHQQEHVGFGYETCRQLAQSVGYHQAVFFRNKKRFVYDF